MTTQELKVLSSRNRIMRIKIEVLTASMTVVGVIEGLAVDGSYSIDKDSATRRTCSVSFKPDVSLTPMTTTSLLRINRRFKLYVGLYDVKENETLWWSQGVFCIDNPRRDISASDDVLTISGVDLAALQDGTLGGQLGVNIKIEADTNIATAIRSTITQLGGENKVNIISTDYTVPYDIEKNAADSVWSTIEDLTKLYMRYESYYDENGYFVFTGTKVTSLDTVAFDFDIYKNLITSVAHEINVQNIKNKIVVWGRLNEDGVQYSSTIEVTDALYPDCPFTIEKMGESSPRVFVVAEEYYTQQQVNDRASYEVEQHTNYAEKITITCLPIYSLTVNRLINLELVDEGITGKWCVDTIQSGLSVDSTMTITAHKIYN